VLITCYLFIFFLIISISRMMQIQNNMSDIVLNINTAFTCNKQYNDKISLIRNNGWFPKTNSISKFLMHCINDDKNENVLKKPAARCFECYELVGFENIGYSRIINNYNRGIEKDKISIKELSIFEKYYKVSVICSGCVSKRDNFKNAPKIYGDIISDFIINDKLDILAYDLGRINCHKLGNLNDLIVKSVFNYNEKQIILNYIIKENDNLKRNLDMEIEKNKILSEYKSKNRELQDLLKNQLLQSSIDIFKSHKQIIDEQIAKYNEYNNSTKYAIPECRICMQHQISMTLECGHLLCIGCHEQMYDENRKKIDENADDVNNDNLIQIDGYPCPFCKTFSSNFIKIFL